MFLAWKNNNNRKYPDDTRFEIFHSVYIKNASIWKRPFVQTKRYQNNYKKKNILQSNNYEDE